MSQASNKPVKVFRIRGVSASVFENQSRSEGRDLTFFKVSLQRTYKDGNEFKSTSSFSRDDIPVARHLLQEAWEFILHAEAHEGEGNQGSSSDRTQERGTSPTGRHSR